MATHYVWQDGPAGGGTSASDTRRTIPNGSAGDSILFKRGTSFVTASQIAIITDNITWADFGDAADARPIYRSTSTSFGQVNVIGGGVIKFRNIDFSECAGNATNGGVVVASTTASTRVASLDFWGCRFTGTSYNAIRINGTNTATAAATFSAQFCEFDRIGEDCVFGGALDYVFAYNTCTNLSSGTLTGDGVGFINADPDRVWIHHNYIDHSGVDCKQCIIIDTTTPGTGVCVIEDNVLIGYGNATTAPSQHTVIISDPVTTIRRNVIYTAGLTCGINTASDRITDNLFMVSNCTSQVASMVADGRIERNTFVATATLNAARSALTMGTGASSAAAIKNNLFVGVPIGIKSDVVGVNPTVGTNAYWQVTTPRTGTAGAFAETGAVTADPLLSSSYRPQVGSPLLGAGTHANYSRDADGKQRPNPPSIGAFDAATLRRVPMVDPSL